MKVKVQWDYVSSLGGPWKKNQEFICDPDVFEAVNKDSPGVLVKVTARKKLISTTPNRQVKSAKNRGQ